MSTTSEQICPVGRYSSPIFERAFCRLSTRRERREVASLFCRKKHETGRVGCGRGKDSQLREKHSANEPETRQPTQADTDTGTTTTPTFSCIFLRVSRVLVDEAMLRHSKCAYPDLSSFANTVSPHRKHWNNVIVKNPRRDARVRAGHTKAGQYQHAAALPRGSPLS